MSHRALVLFALVALTSSRIAPALAAGRLFEQPFVLADPSVVGAITAVSDLNLDGVPDLVLMSSNTPVRVLRGNGDATYQEVQSFSPSGVWPALGDLNADTYPDLVWTVETNP